VIDRNDIGGSFGFAASYAFNYVQAKNVQTSFQIAKEKMAYNWDT
jgi:hypothetical protein